MSHKSSIPARAVSAGAAVVLIIAGIAGSGMEVTPVYRWLAAVLFAFAALAAHIAARSDLPNALPGSEDSQRWRLWLVLITVYGVLIRVAWLEQIPPGLWLDEAHHGLDAFRILETGQWPIFFPANTGREPMIIWLAALFIKWLGPSISAVRLPAVLGGVCLIPAVFYAARPLFGTQPALFAAFFTAASRWELTFSRIGFRSIFVPLFAALATGAALRIRSRAWVNAVMAGLWLGLGIYTAIPYRIFPVLFLPMLLLIMNKNKLSRGSGVGVMLVVYAAALIAASGLLVHFAHFPGEFTARMESTNVFSEPFAKAAGTAVQNFVDLTGMMQAWGDRILRHNAVSHPLADPVTAFMICMGLGAVWVDRKKGLLLSIWWLGMLLPAALAVTQTGPHALRSLGALPPLMIMAGVGMRWVLSWFRSRRMRQVAAVTAVAVVMVWNVWIYVGPYLDQTFHATPKVDAVWGFHVRETELVKQLAVMKSQVIWLSPQLFFHATVQYLRPEDKALRLLGDPTRLREFKANGTGFACVIDSTQRNMFWLRNNPSKRFFDFWEYRYKMTPGEIAAALDSCYIKRTGFNNTADNLLQVELAAAFPDVVPRRIRGYEIWEIPGKDGS